MLESQSAFGSLYVFLSHVLYQALLVYTLPTTIFCDLLISIFPSPLLVQLLENSANFPRHLAKGLLPFSEHILALTGLL